MAAFKVTGALVAVTALVQQAQAWVPELPACTSVFQPFVYSGCYKESVGTGHDTLAFRSSLPLDTTTVEACVAECKGNGFRFAGLEYGGYCFCGETVDGPKADETDCTFPCKGNSSEICGGDSRLSIYQDPTFPLSDNTTTADYHLVGCWTDQSSLGKALGYPQDAVNGATLTTESCLAACKKGGYPFAGTEYGGECYCGVVLANGTALAASPDECNMPCKGNASETCGGPARLTLYVAEDLESLEPCGYQPPSSSSSAVSSTSTAPSSSSVVASSSAASSSSPSISSSTSTSTSTSASASSTKAASTSSIYTSTSTSKSSSTATSTSSSSSSTKATSTSTICTSTTKPATSTTAKPATSSTTAKLVTSTTTSSVCIITTVVPPTCEYKCGNWCSSPLPDWSDNDSCKSGQSRCALQVSACFKNAGWPDAMNCFDFQGWCTDIDGYCKSTSIKSKSKSDCFGRSPPKGGSKPVTSTVTIPCKPTSTAKSTAKPTTTTTTTRCPIPTPTGICTQPSNSRYGYAPGSPVGGIQLPALTCNDLKADFDATPFKLYTDADSSKCTGWGRNKVPDACSSACKAQYDQCIATYAEGCKSNSDSGTSWGGLLSWFSNLFGKRDASYFQYTTAPASEKRTLSWTDTYSTAKSKCQQQYNDCVSCNSNTNGKGKCGSWGTGW